MKLLEKTNSWIVSIYKGPLKNVKGLQELLPILLVVSTLHTTKLTWRQRLSVLWSGYIPKNFIDKELNNDN